MKIHFCEKDVSLENLRDKREDRLFEKVKIKLALNGKQLGQYMVPCLKSVKTQNRHKKKKKRKTDKGRHDLCEGRVGRLYSLAGCAVTSGSRETH